ncbi:MAG: sugar phosphate isomerase/epimerase family protein [Verrucomicrobiales bacterium]
MKNAAVSAAALAADSAPAKNNESTRLKLGFDNFSVRALHWKAPQLIKYAAEQRVDAVLLSDLDCYENHSAEHLKRVGDMARDSDLELHVGTLSICPTSTRFDKRWGSAEEHLRLLLRVAKETGASVARCVLGFSEDRQTPGGIEARIEDTVDVLKKVRNQALDDGVKIAVENHAGDMQGRELATLIEQAGRDFVGATIDSGNATWALEDPLNNFEALHPFILSSGIRDSMLWEYDDGAKVQWTAMGEGLVDWKRYFARWIEVASERPVILETISGFARPFPYLKPDFWTAYDQVRARDFAAFVGLAKKGHEIPPFKASAAMSDAQYQQEQLEKSLRFCRELGLGRKK